jgi:CubicO group peptidase (beta-lactamase class C family)
MRKHFGTLVTVTLMLLFSGVARADIQDVLPELEAYAIQVMEEEKVPGMAYAIVEKDQIIYANGFGLREMGKPARVRPHTVFEIGSTSKAFTVALLAMLDDERKLSWEDKVQQHWRGFAMYDPWVAKELTIADLVSQRSGMPAYSLDLMSFIGFNGSQIARAVRYVEPVTSFRSTFGYVNNLFLVAGKVIESKTGLSWRDNLDVSIFGPLGMTGSTADPEIVATWKDVARGYMVTSDGSLWPIPDNWIYAGWVDTYGPAGGIRSNVLDMANWIRLQLGRGSFEGRRMISRNNVAYMHQPKVFAYGDIFGGLACYGSGWMYNVLSPHVLVWHNGSTMGMHSVVALVPDADVGLVVLTNSNGNQVPERIMTKFYELYFNTTTAKSFRGQVMGAGPGKVLIDRKKPPALLRAPLAHLPYDRYCGVYSHPAYGRMTVKVVHGALFAILGPNHIKASLIPYSGHTFQMALPDFPDGESLATFIVQPDKNAEGVVMEAFSDSNGGRYSRVND